MKKRSGGVWPSTKAPAGHGLCGDPHQSDRESDTFKNAKYMKPTAVQATYIAGDIVEFTIGIHVGHQGHYEFRICETGLDSATLESPEAGQKCLDKWLLKRAPLLDSCQPNDKNPDCQPIDEDYPERWYKPPLGWGSKSQMSANLRVGLTPDWKDENIEPDSPNSTYGVQQINGRQKMRYIIPEGLTCEKCTLQWWWVTGNTCLYDNHYKKYFMKMKRLGWDAQKWSHAAYGHGEVCSTGGKFGEEFWNCADIAVKPKPKPTKPPTDPPIVDDRRRRRKSSLRRRRRADGGRRRRKGSTRRRRKGGSTPTRRRTSGRRRSSRRRR